MNYDMNALYLYKADYGKGYYIDKIMRVNDKSVRFDRALIKKTDFDNKTYKLTKEEENRFYNSIVDDILVVKRYINGLRNDINTLNYSIEESRLVTIDREKINEEIIKLSNIINKFKTVLEIGGHKYSFYDTYDNTAVERVEE